jgi:hypothetical protein
VAEATRSAKIIDVKQCGQRMLGAACGVTFSEHCDRIVASGCSPGGQMINQRASPR